MLAAWVKTLYFFVVFGNIDVAILMSQNNETVAMLLSQTNPLGVKLFSYANHFFCYNKFAWMLATCVKTLYFFVVFGDFVYFFLFWSSSSSFFAAFRFLTGSTGFHSHVSCFSSYRAVQDVILRDIFLTAGERVKKENCWFARDVTAAMLVVKNKSISLLWELNSIFM